MKTAFLSIAFLLLSVSCAHVEKAESNRSLDSVDVPKILFIGSSTIDRWITLKEDFSPAQVINAGVGGSTFEYIIKSVGEAVEKYQPSLLVMYSGDNDLAMGKSPQQIKLNFKLAVASALEKNPALKIFVLSIKPSPARIKFFEATKTTNQLLKSTSEEMTNTTFVDVFSVMLEEDGGIKSYIFAPDNLHLNEKGYQLWTGILRSFLLP